LIRDLMMRRANRVYPRAQSKAFYFRVLSALLLLLTFCGAAFARDMVIQKFVSEVVVSPNGSIDVTETIEVKFIGSWNGVYRSIPVEYVTPQGFDYSLLLDVKRVTDENGEKLKFESSRVRHYRKLKIYVPGAQNTTRTIVIEYSVADGLRFFEDHDELYWNVTGDEWDYPIQSASVNIVLPSGAANIRANPFTGGFGSRAQDADVNIVGNGVEVRTRAPLRFHEGLTVAVAFDKGAVREPTAIDRAVLFLRSNWPLLSPVLAFVVMFYLWWTIGRDPRLRPISAQYEPPDQLTPGEAGTLIDNSADMRDITATIVDLAVRGYMVIEEHDKPSMLGLRHDKDFKFILQKERSTWAGLKTHEQVLLNGFFTMGTVGESVSMSSLENQFYKNLPQIKSGIFQSLITKGYYRRRPDSVRSSYLGIGVVIGILAIWGGTALGAMFGMPALTFMVAGVLTGAVICAFGWFMPAHTEQGARAMEGVLGFEDFLNHVESDRFNRMIKTPEMFEKFLPFAMALGVEKNWSKAFQGILVQPPDWYRGGVYGPNFYPMAFTNNLSYMSTQAGSVMASAPRSSGGSGFGGGGGGGGFSGGGFGGGGGGGF
jgi:uncharacterized membrane protein